MIIQKLRLQNGWSQQQLGEMSGLSTRTIQRIENGKKPSTESVKSLAAVFEVDFLTLQEALTMNNKDNTTVVSDQKASLSDLQINDIEQQAYQHVRKLKRFYTDIMIFAAVIVFLAMINWFVSPNYWWVIWVFLGWGLSFLVRAAKLFAPLPWLDAKWEQQQVDNQMSKRK